MMKAKELATCINYYEDVFETGDFIDLVEAECALEWGYLQWNIATVGDREVNSHRTSRNCYLGTLHSDLISVDRVKVLSGKWISILEKIDDRIRDYTNEFSLNLTADTGYSILKYGEGAEYHYHWDHHPDNSRVVSMVAFLNDVPNGGELEFPLFDVTIKPKAGSVVVFPSNYPYLHIAHATGLEDNSIKYSLATWFK